MSGDMTMTPVTENELKALEEKAQGCAEVRANPRYDVRSARANLAYRKAVDDPQVVLNLIATIRELRREVRVRDRALENIAVERYLTAGLSERDKQMRVRECIERAQRELEGQ